MKQLAFYVFDEHTDFVAECKKMGMKPIKGESFVEEFLFGDTIYRTLAANECYSGWEITLMALPEMEYNKMVNMLFQSREYDEQVGCLGILLKKYSDKFLDDLEKRPNTDRRLRKVKKMISSIITQRTVP